MDAADLADFDVKTLEAQLSAAKKAREALFNALQDGFKKADLRSATGANGGARISLVTTKSPSITDRSKLEAYIKKHKAFELFQARVNKQAWLERMDADGKPIPGVQSFDKTSIRINRSK